MEENFNLREESLKVQLEQDKQEQIKLIKKE